VAGIDSGTTSTTSSGGLPASRSAATVAIPAAVSPTDASSETIVRTIPAPAGRMKTTATGP
jgi:hypothetical protein